MSKKNNHPLVIDNGSFECRAGWSGQSEPSLCFRNLLVKEKGSGFSVGSFAEDLSYSMKSAFDENVVYHFDAQEAVFDHIFTQLKVSTVDFPLVITEPLCNPHYSRKNMCELLFECYNAPSLSYGVDSLFSMYQNGPHIEKNCLLVSCGYKTSHIIPFVGGKPISSSAKRVSVGGYHCTNYLQRILQIKFPLGKNTFTEEKTQAWKEEHCYVANNYLDELSTYNLVDNNKIRTIQLAVPTTIVPQPVQDMERKQEIRLQQAKRLREYTENKRKKNLEDKEKQLQVLEELLSIEISDPNKFELGLKEEGISSASKLKKQYDKLKAQISESIQPKQPPATPQQSTETADEVLEGLQKRRKLIQEKKEKRHQQNSQATRGRNTVGKQKRLNALAEIAFDEENDDMFGANDDDWNIYVAASNEPDAESETENAELQQIDRLIAKYEKEKSKRADKPTSSNTYATGYDHNAVYLGVERIRIPEILWEPSLFGVNQMGVSEAIYHVLNSFEKDTRSTLIENVFVTGGTTKFPNFCDRVNLDIQSFSPSMSKIAVKQAADPSHDAWKGASTWASSCYNNNQVKQYFISKKEYYENGADGSFLKSFWASNVF